MVESPEINDRIRGYKINCYSVRQVSVTNQLFCCWLLMLIENVEIVSWKYEPDSKSKNWGGDRLIVSSEFIYFALGGELIAN